MEHKPIPGTTRTFGPPGDMGGYCGALQVVDVLVGNADPSTGQQLEFGSFMVSRWQPSEEELAQLNKGGSVYLWIRGATHPVVMVGTTHPLAAQENSNES